jgi:zinc transporter 1
VHELHIWRLDQKKTIASAHIVVSEQSVSRFAEKASTIRECLHDYGIHSITLQPEVARAEPEASTPESAASAFRKQKPETGSCQAICGKGLCERLTCCGQILTSE